MIYQVCVGDTPPLYYKTCIQSVAEYCKRHNIDHIIQREPILKIKPINSRRSENALKMGYLPIYEKENAFNYLDDYDQICIVDADIFIRESAPNIFDELKDDTVFAGVLEKDMPLTPQYVNKIKAYSDGQYKPLQKEVSDWETGSDFGYAFYNMGLMLFTNKIKTYLNGETPEQFIRRPEFQRFVDGEGSWRWSTDQTLLNYWVRKSGMKLQNLDWRWNALFKAVTDKKILDSYFIHFFLSANLPKKGAEIIDIVRDLDRAADVKYRHY